MKDRDIPITDIIGLEEEGVISPRFILDSQDALPKHITTAVMLFDRTPDDEIIKDSIVFYNFLAASVSIPQYIYKDRIVLSYAPLGSAAAGGLLEELIALGIKEVFACGSAGAIGDIDTSNFLLVDKAIRDEGLSYHYLEPSVYVELDEDFTQVLKNELDNLGIKHITGTTWTTDGFFRETKSRITKRKAQGAVSVEMECAGLAAVAKYRNIKFAQLLYFSDIVKQEIWSGFVEETPSIRKKISHLVLKIALNL